jgi:hypothetical protein
MSKGTDRFRDRFKHWEEDTILEKREMVLRTFEYRLPFKYANVQVERALSGGEPHGMEMYAVPDGKKEEFVYGQSAEDKDPAKGNRWADGFVITEDYPIVRVAVVGSACTPPGYVTLEGGGLDEDWRRADEMLECMPVRMRVDDLWGQHMRFDQALECDGEAAGRPFPQHMPERWKEFSTGTRLTAREMPLAGMSCAIFEIPPCKWVRVAGGSATPGWKSDNCPDDNHYSFKIIRVTVDAPA